jgi:hypothetical protein
MRPEAARGVRVDRTLKLALDLSPFGKDRLDAAFHSQPP